MPTSLIRTEIESMFYRSCSFKSPHFSPRTFIQLSVCFLLNSRLVCRKSRIISCCYSSPRIDKDDLWNEWNDAHRWNRVRTTAEACLLWRLNGIRLDVCSLLTTKAKNIFRVFSRGSISKSTFGKSVERSFSTNSHHRHRWIFFSRKPNVSMN